jgi:hypothetical protein
VLITSASVVYGVHVLSQRTATVTPDEHNLGGSSDANTSAFLASHCLSPLLVLQYWLVVLTPLPLMMIVWALMRWHVLWRVGWQNVLGMTHPTDIAWTATSTLTFPAIVITVGVMAGMLGLGGGIVLVSCIVGGRVLNAGTICVGGGPRQLDGVRADSTYTVWMVATRPANIMIPYGVMAGHDGRGRRDWCW